MSGAPNSLLCRLLLLVTGASLALTACSSSTSTSPSGDLSSAAGSSGVSTSGVSTSSVSSSPTPSSSTGAAGSPSGPVDHAFLSRANAVCAAGVAYAKKHPFRFESFNGSSAGSTTPPRTVLPKLADYYEKTPDVVTRLIALPAPKTGKASWRKVVAVLEALEANHVVQTRAAANAERELFTQAVHAGGTITGQLRTVAGPAGLLSATSCVTYFTG